MTNNQLHNLILDCKKNRPLSQKKIYQHFFNYGMTISARYAQNESEAREILNDSFVKVFMKINKYNPTLSFKAWLNKIIVNTAIDHYRKRKENPIIVDLIYAKNIETSVEEIEQVTSHELLKLVQHLSPSYRMVFNLYAIEGLKHNEIANHLGISVGTSKSNLAKARLKLKVMLQKLNDKKSKYG